MKIIECVPNFSEGQSLEIIQAITDAIASVDGVKLLDVDPGAATNRTVVTFVGSPESVIDGAFEGIKRAAQLIDMTTHTGEHPRMGATDVCPLIPVSGISLEETVQYAKALGERVGRELGIPIYLYEAAAQKPDRKNLATIRAGEYEGFGEKMKNPQWAPDYGPTTFNAKAGATVIGARDFLVAYNVNLNTTSTRRANSVAFDIREKGRLKREGDPITGKVVKDANGQPIRVPGKLKGVKAIGWYIEEYGVAQISMNITDVKQTSLYEAFEACVESAQSRGLRVTGSELVGMVPLKVLLDAGRHFLRKQQRSTGVPDADIIKIAVKSMGLDELGPFDPTKKIIEYAMLRDEPRTLTQMTLVEFANETSSESPAPGGGSVSAYVGALGTALGTMVANLSSHKRGWDDRWEEFGDQAAKGQMIKERLLKLVDDDTAAFNDIMTAIRLPKNTAEEKMVRKAAIEAATKHAIEVPLEVMEVATEAFSLLRSMTTTGNPNSVSDAGVGALCIRAAVHGAHLNVLINASGLDDQAYLNKILTKANALAENADREEAEIIILTKEKIQ